MSVYTVVTLEELAPWLEGFDLGRPAALEGIAEGVVNTNYRLFTDRGPWILTLVEPPDQGRELPYLTALMEHMARRGIPAPLPMADRQGRVIHHLKGKSALIVSHLPGRSPLQPTPEQCRRIGAMQGRMHREAVSFTARRPNPVGPPVWRALLAKVSPRLAAAAQGETLALLAEELERAEEAFSPRTLPAGACHLDLFPDNTLFEGEELTGVIDFHYAGHEWWLYDLAVTLNAWCFLDDGVLDPARFHALWAGYLSERPPSAREMALLPAALRASALRFALTRLEATLFPREGSNVTRKPPEAFLARLHYHRHHPLNL
ncbi:MAG: homoserine kinase [Magnetococcales bacterium]|nr:homoserine kinase [Magnetococcales bacterium]